VGWKWKFGVWSVVYIEAAKGGEKVVGKGKVGQGYDHEGKKEFPAKRVEGDAARCGRRSASMIADFLFEWCRRIEMGHD
jgi:hypothetical protein